MRSWRGSRCKMVIGHLMINWLSYNLALFVVLWNTSSCFDHTEYAAITAMAILTLGLGVMQYDIWKARYDVKSSNRRKSDLVNG